MLAILGLSSLVRSEFRKKSRLPKVTNTTFIAISEVSPAPVLQRKTPPLIAKISGSVSVIVIVLLKMFALILKPKLTVIYAT